MDDYIKREDAVLLCRQAMKFSLEAMMSDPEIVPSVDIRESKTDNEYLVVQLEDLIQELKEENEWEENDLGKAFRLGKIHAYESVLKALKESEDGNVRNRI